MDRFASTVAGGVLTVDTSKITLGPLPVALGQPGLIPPRPRELYLITGVSVHGHLAEHGRWIRRHGRPMLRENSDSTTSLTVYVTTSAMMAG